MGEPDRDPTLINVATFLTDRIGPDVSQVRSLGSGAWSQAYAFVHLGAAFVVRFSAHLDDFEKDRRAARYASPNLPIPAIVDLGPTEDGFFAISEHSQGVGLDTIDAEHMVAVVPALLQTLDALANVDITGTRQFGHWTPSGAGTRTTWRQSLLDVGHDQPGSRTHGWRQRLADSNFGLAVFDEGLRHLHDLAEHCPEVRGLVHSDLLNNNVLVEATRISAVLDWGSSKYGDPLYDAAWLSFWWPWYTQWKDIDIDSILLDHFVALRTERLTERLTCYRLHIGLEGIAYEAFVGHWDELAWTQKRTLTILDETA